MLPLDSERLRLIMRIICEAPTEAMRGLVIDLSKVTLGSTEPVTMDTRYDAAHLRDLIDIMATGEPNTRVERIRALHRRVREGDEKARKLVEAIIDYSRRRGEVNEEEIEVEWSDPYRARPKGF